MKIVIYKIFLKNYKIKNHKKLFKITLMTFFSYVSLSFYNKIK